MQCSISKPLIQKIEIILTQKNTKTKTKHQTPQNLKTPKQILIMLFIKPQFITFTFTILTLLFMVSESTEILCGLPTPEIVSYNTHATTVNFASPSEIEKASNDFQQFFMQSKFNHVNITTVFENLKTQNYGQFVGTFHTYDPEHASIVMTSFHISTNQKTDQVSTLSSKLVSMEQNILSCIDEETHTLPQSVMEIVLERLTTAMEIVEEIVENMV